MGFGKLKIEIPVFSEWRLDKHELVATLGIKGGYFANPEQPNFGELMQYCSDFTSTPMDQLDRLKPKEVFKIFRTITSQVSSYQPSPPPKELVFNDVVYVLRNNFADMTAGWHRHVYISDFMQQPEMIFALCYIEKGMQYGHQGPNDTILNPTSVRAEVMRDNVTIAQYLDLNGFFLQKWTEYRPLYIQIQATRALYPHLKKSNNLNMRIFYGGWLMALKKVWRRLTAGTS